jgi:hypothetical protein
MQQQAMQSHLFSQTPAYTLYGDGAAAAAE